MEGASEGGEKRSKRLAIRSWEVRESHPIVSYYCMLRSAEHAIRASKSDAKLQSTALERLEEAERLRRIAEPELDPKKDKKRLESFALHVFAQADESLRRGEANVELARRLYASALFLDASRACEDCEGCMEEKKKVEIEKYAIRKAAEIAQKSRGSVGGTPSLPDVGGIFGEEEELEEAFEKLDPDQEQGDETGPKELLPGTDGERNSQGNDVPFKPNKKETIGKAEHYETNVPTKRVLEATKHSRNAVSALQFNDIPTAISNLKKALDLLR